MSKPHQPLPMGPVPDPLEPAFEPLLGEPFAAAWAGGPADPQVAALRDRLRGRLMDRLAASHAAAGVMVTARRSRLQAVELAPGVWARTLYDATAAGDRGRVLRPGEPLRVRLVELQAGSRWSGPSSIESACRQRDWLVLQGSVQLGDETLQLRDYHVAPAGRATRGLRTQAGALLVLRESVPAAGADAAPFRSAVTVHDADAGWPAYAPGIRRRVLWQHAGQAALLYHAQPGAAVPQHTHGHDEECLLVQGELFLDDVLLQAGDYQLAPAGSGHRITHTDTGVVIYAHGDLDLQFVR
jgi:quercetin dioxygenase-like cupin family protein